MTTTRAHQRLCAMLDHALGPLILTALATPGTSEVMVNSNGSIWHERHGSPAVCIGTQEPGQTEAVLRLVASGNHTAIHAESPSLAGVLPCGQRFQGWLPPRATAACFCIRVPQAQVLTREAWVPQCCTAEVWDVLARAVASRNTILLVGAMSSGKSTLMNSIVAMMPHATRVATFEDVRELSVMVPNYLQLYAADVADLGAVVKEGFRTAASRCLVGEIRDGVTALQALKLWLAVGGGIATTHADSARDALTRLQYLCAEVSPGDYQPLLGDVIDLIVYLRKEETTGQRHIAEVLKVNGWNGETYELEVML